MKETESKDVGQGYEESGTPYIAGGNVKWCNCK